MSALLKAIRHRKPAKGLIYHTGRGVEYKALIVQDVLTRYGITPSNNRPFKSIDNAEMEPFFKTLKGDAIRGCVFNSIDQLRSALRSYINYFYNRDRLHSKLGYRTPVEYEALRI